jgi:hypothetical protein
MERVALAVAVLILGPGHCGLAGQAGAPGTQVLVLRPVRGPGLRIDLDFRFGRALPAFEKEPTAGGKELARGLVPTVPPTAFIRNVTDNELYVDATHGRDFVTSPLAIYKGQTAGHVFYQGLRVSTVQGSATIPYTVDFVTYEHGSSGWLQVRSAWAASLTTEGVTWELGVVDNLDGQIDGNDTLFVHRASDPPGRYLMSHCAIPEVLSWLGHTWELQFHFTSDSAGAVVEAALTELDGPAGRLICEAGCTRSVQLRGERCVVLVDPAAGSVSLPEGAYRVEDVALEGESGNTEIPRFMGLDRRVSIQTGQTSILRIGTPMSHTVKMTRDKNLWRFSYRLVGRGGENYICYNWRRRPVLAIHKGPLTIATGTFPFG